MKTHLRRLTLATALAMALMGAGHAALAAEPESDCQTSSFPGTFADGVSIASVNAPRLPILRDEDGCPEAGESCQTKAYIVLGDKVITAQARGPFRCVAYLGKQGQTTGWVRQDGLSPADAAPVGDWAGVWKRARGSGTLTIRKRGQHYDADMLATATTANPENVRTGAASGTMTIDGMQATVIDGRPEENDVCRVDIRRLGALLLVNDGGTPDANSECDGMGVTLNGVYRRTSRP
jgi:hypothetical protein